MTRTAGTEGTNGELTASERADVIDVREDERLDADRLADYLKGRLEGAEGPLEIRQFGGGHANLTYLLRFGGGEGQGVREYVLRRPPHGTIAPGAHDMKREYRALSKLWRGFPYAPRAFLLCEDHDVAGADFFVMERRYGVVVRREVPPEFGGGDDPVVNRKLSEVVVDTLAELHALEPASVGLEGIGRPEGFLERQVTGWSDRMERARTGDDPVAEELSRWLLDNLPASPAPTLLHNDWKLDNMAVSRDDPGVCTAVFDWDMCTQGDPLCDVGSLMSYWIEQGDGGTAVAMPTHLEGFMSSGQALERYAERTGTDLSVMPYYVVFGVFKTAVVLQQLFARFHKGQTQDDRFAGLGEGAKALFGLAASLRP